MSDRESAASVAVFWVHGLPARSLEQVADYLTGDAHDQSKVQVYVGDRFYDVAVPPKPAKASPPASGNGS